MISYITDSNNFKYSEELDIQKIQMKKWYRVLYKSKKFNCRIEQTELIPSGIAFQYRHYETIFNDYISLICY